jgi:hypothetical protein
MDTIVAYLTMKRFFIFLDEWLSYLILFGLYWCEYYVIFGIAVILAIVFNGYGYFSYWRVEEKYNDYLIDKLSIERDNEDTAQGRRET